MNQVSSQTRLIVSKRSYSRMRRISIFLFQFNVFMEFRAILEKNLCKVFPENETFATNFHEWVCKHFGKNSLDFSTLLHSRKASWFCQSLIFGWIVAVFLKKSTHWDAMEIFCLIVCANYHVKTQSDAYNHSWTMAELKEVVRVKNLKSVSIINQQFSQ